MRAAASGLDLAKVELMTPAAQKKESGTKCKAFIKAQRKKERIQNKEYLRKETRITGI